MSEFTRPSMRYSLLEDVLSAATHGVGVIMGIAGLVMLIRVGLQNADLLQVVSGSIFGASLVFAYLSSTLYHSLRLDSVRTLFRKLDHSAIYVLIAGTYTALMLGVIRGAWGWSFFGVVWGIALMGILLKIFRLGKHPRLSLATYLIMGWLCVIAIYPLWKQLPREAFLLLVAGGIVYSIGAGVYAMKRIRYTHAVWHLFVLSGSILHFLSIYFAFRVYG